MSDMDRVLGRLEEFKDATLLRLDKIESRVESIQHLKWKIVGGVTVLSFIVGTAINVLMQRNH